MLDNLKQIEETIIETSLQAGRNSDHVKIMAVTKWVPPEIIEKAIKTRITLFGENRVQEARSKHEIFAGKELCMIGNLQRNKVSMAVRIFQQIHTIDTPDIARTISKFALKYRKDMPEMPVMVQVNVSSDPTKHGVLPGLCTALCHEVMELPGIKLTGLMTVPSGHGSLLPAQRGFAALNKLKDNLIRSGIPEVNMVELSMGMSADYQVAIKEGATIIRLGTCLFGPRTPAKKGQ